MIDYLLRFDGEAEAITALPDLRVSPEMIDDGPQSDRWADSILLVALVTADAVYGEPVDDAPFVVAPRVTLPGFFLLISEADQPGQVATIERETGRILSGDASLLGMRLDPAWAGAEPVLRDG